MRLRHVLAAAVAGTSLVSSVAHATLTISLVPVVVRYDDPARTNGSDPYPTNARTYNVMVTQTGTEKWTTGVVKFSLAQVSNDPANPGVNLSGSFFISPNHAAKNKYAGTGVALDPTLQYDTYITSPDFDYSVAHSAQDATHLDTLGTSDIGQTATLGSGTISGPTMDISWGDKNSGSPANNLSGPGTWRIASLTVAGNTGGVVSGYVQSTSDAATNAKEPFSTYLPIAADLNESGAVDGSDLSDFLSTFGFHDDPANTSDKTLFAGDFNQDGQVDGADLSLFLSSFGNHLATSGAVADITPAQLAQIDALGLGSLVPEPATGSLLAIGLLGMASRRRK